MKERSYAVIGLGQFGMTVALTLAEANGDVLAIDENDDNVQDIAEKVTYAVKADFTVAGSSECRCGCDRSGRKYGSQHYSNHAGERTGSALCHGKSDDLPAWKDSRENRSR